MPRPPDPEPDTRGTSVTLNLAVYQVGELFTLLEDAGYPVEHNVGQQET